MRRAALPIVLSVAASLAVLIVPAAGAQTAGAALYSSTADRHGAVARPASPFQAAAANAGTGTISGRVTSTGGSAVQGVIVAAYDPVANSQAGAATTDLNGNYSIAGLHQGFYVVLASPVGLNFQSRWLGDVDPTVCATGSNYLDNPNLKYVQVKTGIDAPGNDVQVVPGSPISGRVTGAPGNSPVADAAIEVIDGASGCWVAGAFTDNAGNWSSPGLASGSYRVHVIPPVSTSLAGAWFNNKATYTSSDPVAPGQSNVNIALDNAGRPVGQLGDRLAQPVAGTRFEALGSDNTVLGVGEVDTTGAIRINAIPAGAGFTLRAIPPTGNDVRVLGTFTMPANGSNLDLGTITLTLNERNPNNTWYFAEGTTLQPFRTFLLLFNPETTATAYTNLTFNLEGAPPVFDSVAVPPQTRVTVVVNDVVGNGQTGVALSLLSSRGIIAERSIYEVQDFGFGAINGATGALGLRAPRQGFLFAEGSTLPGFQEYLTLQNPGTQNATVSILYGLEGGPSATVARTYAVPSNGRLTVDVNSPTTGAGPGITGVSALVKSDQPILAERPMYFARDFGTGDVANGAHIAPGSEPNESWFLAEGNVLQNWNEFVTIANPSATETAPVTLTYQLEGGAAPISKQVTVNPNGRLTVQVYDETMPGGIGRNVSDPVSRGVSAVITSSKGIVVERPLYTTAGAFAPGAPLVNMGHNQPGATSFGNFIYFAGESTLDGFYQFFTLQNPNAVASPTTIRYFTNTGQVIDRSVTLPPNSRTTVQVFNAQEVGKGALGQVFEGIATKIISAQPILVERPFYIAGRDVLGLTIDDGTDVLGTLADF